MRDEQKTKARILQDLITLRERVCELKQSTKFASKVKLVKGQLLSSPCR